MRRAKPARCSEWKSCDEVNWIGVDYTDSTAEDGVFRYRYKCNDTTDWEHRYNMYLRKDGGNAFLKLYAKPSQIMLQQYDGDWTTLDNNTSISTTQGTWYDITMVLDGEHVEVWRDEEQVLSTDAATVLEAGSSLRFEIKPGAWWSFDDTVLATADPVTTVYEYNDANELTKMTENAEPDITFTYDDWGRTITKTQTVGQTTYTAVHKYRYGDKLKLVDTDFPGETDVSFIYDGLGKRRYKAVDPDGANTVTWYRWDAGWNVLAEYADTGDFWDIGTMQTSYTYHGMSVLGETPGSDPSSGTYRCYLHDHLGSTRALYDDDKVLLASIEHLPYGSFLSNAGASENPGGMPTFTGKPYDAEIGLYYLPYRYYSPTASRWLTRDPLGMVDGPNVYSYASTTPIMYYDTHGSSVGLAALIALIAAALVFAYAAYKFCKAGSECMDALEQFKAEIDKKKCEIDEILDPLEQAKKRKEVYANLYKMDSDKKAIKECPDWIIGGIPKL